MPLSAAMVAVLANNKAVARIAFRMDEILVK
jgi:hypothetical protein